LPLAIFITPAISLGMGDILREDLLGLTFEPGPVFWGQVNYYPSNDNNEDGDETQFFHHR
ncbi:MAG: hypothetical protein PVG20_00420, partial [Thioalkalispiraceae bacterium]